MKILIADDEPVAARILQRAIEASGHEVVVATSGNEAWEIFNRESVRLIVSDWVMPGLDGLELCEKVRSRRNTPYTYFILLTQKETKPENFTMASEAGVDDFLTKPLDRSAIRMRLRVAERILRSTVQIRQLKDLVAARRKSEKLLRTANAALIERERQLLVVSEEERQRIGADLHDNLGQQMTAIEMLCHSLRQQVQDQPDLDARLEQICEFLQNAVSQIRHIARGLIPAPLSADGLTDGLAEMARGMSHGSVGCNFVCTGTVDVGDAGVANHLFHIAQEAVNNAVKHARATQVTVTLSQQRDAIDLRIEDDGQGFPATAKAAASVGLRNMRYRANVIGATLETTSQPGKGVKVRCTLKSPA